MGRRLGAAGIRERLTQIDISDPTCRMPLSPLPLLSPAALPPSNARHQGPGESPAACRRLCGNRFTLRCLPPIPSIPSPPGLGVNLVVVAGVQNQIDDLLRERGMQPRYMDGYRLTDRDAMKVVIEAAGEARTQCEQSLSKVCG